MTSPPHLPDSTRSLLDVFRDRETRSTALWLFALMSSAYFLTAPGRIDIVDGAIRFDVTHNLIELGRPIITHRVPAVQAPSLDFYAFYQFGTSVLALPFVLLARSLAPGSINAEQFAFTLTTIPFAALTVAVLFCAYVRLGLSRPAARNWALLCGFGSMLWPYAGSTFELAPQAFFLTLGVLAGADALRFDSRKLGGVSGLCFLGLATIQEMYLPLAGALLCAAPGWRWRDQLEKLRKPASVWIAAGIVAGLVAVVLYNFSRFGDPFRTGREIVSHPILGNPLAGLLGLLLSPAKSVFLYSPLHLLGLWGLYELRRREPGWVLPALATCALHLLLVACLACWAGEWAWGPRYLLATAPLVLLGAPFALPVARQTVVRALAGAAVFVQLLSLATDHHVYYVNKDFRPFFWVENRHMYTDSPLLRRPSEIWKALQFEGYRPGMNDLKPNPPSALQREDWIAAYQRLLMPERVVTTSMGRVPVAVRRERLDWANQYYVLNAPRPWVLWSLGLPAELRPAPVLPWLGLGLFGLLLSLWRLLSRAATAALGTPMPV
jgi:hypothetical protein